MKDFKKIKTIQLITMVGLIIVILIMIFRNKALYHSLATSTHAHGLLILVWLLLVICFAFLIYDFIVYSSLRRKYGEMDMAMYSDPMTGIGNRSSLDAFIDEYSEKELPIGIGSVTFIICHMAEINKEYGNNVGNEIIKDFSNILADAGKGRCFVGRNGGNQFLALFRETTESDINEFVEIIKEKTESRNSGGEKAPLIFKVGMAIHTNEDNYKMNELVASSYRMAATKTKDDCGVWKD